MGRITISEKATFLRNFTLGASDGLVTTFAIVAGIAGASLSSSYVIVLGLAKLLADAVSMSAGMYLGAKSEIEYKSARENHHHKETSPLRQGIIMFLSFISIGSLPLFPYLFDLPSKFSLSAITVALVLFVIGGIRGAFAGKKVLKGSIEMLLVGGSAASVAYLVGFLLKNFTL